MNNNEFNKKVKKKLSDHFIKDSAYLMVSASYHNTDLVYNYAQCNLLCASTDKEVVYKIYFLFSIIAIFTSIIDSWNIRLGTSMVLNILFGLMA